jgi:LCP family protein required for cell wall assembly
MKHFLKVFFIALICFGLAAASMFVAFMVIGNNSSSVNNVDAAEGSENTSDSNENNENNKIETDPLKKAIKESKRINVLLLGLEGPRTDTIIFASFDPKTKKVSMISIPRDTYFYRKGYETSDQKKINAVYGAAGVKGTMKAVENVLGGVPIHHYVRVTYNGVEKIVDSLGGVEVNVPFHMHYRDPDANPPLVIDVPAGRQILKGEKAVQFLRFRQSNDKTVGYKDGDLGRIRAQQQFLKSAIKKALSYRLPVVATTVYKYVKTDLGLTDLLLYVNDVIGIKLDDISMTTLPGKAKYIDGVSYFVHDPHQVRELMMELYGVEEEQTNSEE